MSINREQRRKVADNLAALMRWKIADSEYLARGRKIFEEIERSDKPDKFALYNAAFEWMNPPDGDHTLSTDDTTWKAMCSRLAFLESDLEMKREGYDTVRGSDIWAVLASIIGVIVVGYSYATWIGLGVGAGFVCSSLWCAAGFGAALAINIHAQLNLRKESCHHFHPFNDEQQFREYQRLLDRFNLPAYDSTKHKLPVKNACSAFTWVLSGVSVVLFTLLRSVLPMIFGPLLLIGALKPGRRPRYVAVKGSES